MEKKTQGAVDSVVLALAKKCQNNMEPDYVNALANLLASISCPVCAIIGKKRMCCKLNLNGGNNNNGADC